MVVRLGGPRTGAQIKYSGPLVLVQKLHGNRDKKNMLRLTKGSVIRIPKRQI